ncbi:adenylyl-sulfate kinase [Corallococcus sp. ZKHCc1 1396]|uniref:Adenylyl-sulfate kinase n=1 Tax=Corallococcus soli TaxID=2710757 RepID=A0ABR9Q097_9BACT|nr:adenylyl-sulfate kinase [Corallococcus soli]MBE4753593.1 adenylyl-sulfate kinase [Corallococcus soli]
MRQGPGFILWFTGLSGAGKSTLATEVLRRLEPVQRVELLDGDEFRASLSRGLGFSREDREENVRRIGYVARLLAKHEVGVLTAAISPYRSSRDELRAQATQAGIPFLEVHVHASLDALIARDVKGLYKRALAGELSRFTGVSDPYEPPESPEVVVRSDAETVVSGVERILETLRNHGLLAPSVSVA